MMARKRHHEHGKDAYENFVYTTNVTDQVVQAVGLSFHLETVCSLNVVDLNEQVGLLLRRETGVAFQHHYIVEVTLVGALTELDQVSFDLNLIFAHVDTSLAHSAGGDQTLRHPVVLLQHLPLVVVMVAEEVFLLFFDPQLISDALDIIIVILARFVAWCKQVRVALKDLHLQRL